MPVRHRLIAPILVLSLALEVAGCGSVIREYEGTERSQKEIAELSAINVSWVSYPFERGQQSLVTGIDGKPAYGVQSANDRFALLPGKHQIGVYYRRYRTNLFGGSGEHDDTRTEIITLDFVAEAGHKYQIEAYTESDTAPLYLWVVDVDLGSLVAGQKPG